MADELPFGTTSGLYLSLYYFKAIALNEGPEVINAMSNALEKLNQHGYEILKGLEGE